MSGQAVVTQLTAMRSRPKLTWMVLPPNGALAAGSRFDGYQTYRALAVMPVSEIESALVARSVLFVRRRRRRSGASGHMG